MCSWLKPFFNLRNTRVFPLTWTIAKTTNFGSYDFVSNFRPHYKWNVDYFPLNAGKAALIFVSWIFSDSNWIEQNETHTQKWATKKEKKKNEMKVDRIVGSTRIAFYCLFLARQQSAPLLSHAQFFSATFGSKWIHLHTRWPDFCLYCHKASLVHIELWIWHRIVRVCCVSVRFVKTHFNTLYVNSTQRLSGREGEGGGGDKSGFCCSCICCNQIRHVVASSSLIMFLLFLLLLLRRFVFSHIQCKRRQKWKKKQQHEAQNSSALMQHTNDNQLNMKKQWKCCEVYVCVFFRGKK